VGEPWRASFSAVDQPPENQEYARAFTTTAGMFSTYLDMKRDQRALDGYYWKNHNGNAVHDSRGQKLLCLHWQLVYNTVHPNATLLLFMDHGDIARSGSILIYKPYAHFRMAEHAYVHFGPLTLYYRVIFLFLPPYS